ncbi:hypothetical protein AB8O64_11235 [Streptomyces sp. QH1-20]|uniref:hypothetical protein n=1 Tax=Streptomyces sp. QH1-20 TaxID=3240934 RepID=UPI003513E621
MASALLTQHALATNPSFQARVRMAFSHVAKEICAEDPTTPGHDLRYALARIALNPSDLTASGYAPVIATDTEVAAAAQSVPEGGASDAAQEAVGDELILAAVRKVWNSACGWVPGSNGQAEGP